MKRPHAMWSALLLFGCAGPHATPAPAQPTAAATPVRTASVRAVSHDSGEEVVGTVRARSQAAVSASVMGTITALKVSVGSHVHPGQLLALLSAGELEAKAAQARAAFAQASIEMQRAEQLKGSGSVPSSQYDSAQAHYRLAKSALEEAEVMRGYTRITAPLRGVVTQKLANVGDLALPGKPLLVLENPDALRLEAAVPEASAQTLNDGDRLPVHIDALQRDFSASVSEISPSADPESRTVLVKLDLPALPELRPGMFGRLHLRGGARETLAIPAAALVRRGQMESVIVVRDGAAELRLVRIADAPGPQLEVLAGLDPGERVVVSHPAALHDGQALELQP